MKKILALLLLVISNVAVPQINPLDPTQVYNTVNIVNNTTSPTNTTGTWQNIGLWNQGLPCWGPGGPVYCGPLPYFNNGSFNFSYGTTDVYQTANVANSLPSSGTGLRVNGYNFSFMAKNGNGWDDVRPDYLIAYTIFRDSKGVEKYFKSYDLNQNFGQWVNYSFSETFTTPFPTKDLGTVQYGFVGRDNNYWAGPYGPEVTNINFSLKYSVDPCTMNPLYSASCPGFLDALAKNTNNTSTGSSMNAIETPTTQTTVTVVQPIQQNITQNNTIQNNQAQNNQNKDSKETSNNGLSIGLNVINKNQQREQTIINQTISNAINTSQNSASQSQQEAMSVVTQSIASNNSATITPSSTLGSGIRVSPSAFTSLPQPQTINNQNSSSSILDNSQKFYYNQVEQDQTFTSNSSFLSNLNVTIALVPINENNAVSPLNFLTNRANPIAEIIENRQQIPQSQQRYNLGSSVNKNVENNELSVGSDINRISVVPNGFNNYTNLVLKDNLFYEPKTVYPNQRVIDNTRALRQLANDQKHKEMIEMQYVK